MEQDTFGRLHAMTREVIAASMRKEGLDPAREADWTEYRRRFAERVAARDAKNRKTPRGVIWR